MEKLLKPDEVAELLGIDVVTLYRWRYKRSGPPAIKMGKYLRFRESDVSAWVDECQRYP